MGIYFEYYQQNFPEKKCWEKPQSKKRREKLFGTQLAPMIYYSHAAGEGGAATLDGVRMMILILLSDIRKISPKQRDGKTS